MEINYFIVQIQKLIFLFVDNFSSDYYFLITTSLLPLDVGDTKSRFTSAAPVSWPSSVMRVGSPPNDPMFTLIHCKEAAMSLIPRLSVEKSPPFL